MTGGRGGGGLNERRYPPLINRGYYARVSAVRRAMDAFLSTPLTPCDDVVEARGISGVEGADADERRGRRGSTGERQIVSLGAGSDTSYFRLRSEGRAPARYVEVDFPEVMRRKAGVVNAVDELRALCVGGDGVAPVPGTASDAPAVGGEERAAVVLGDGGGYRLVSADLRDVSALDAAVRASGFDPALPTLFVAECCLVYVPPTEAAAVLSWAAAVASEAPASCVVLYDPIGPDDPFGRQMLINLEARGCPLIGIDGAPDLEAQRRRLRACGWEASGASDMNGVYAALSRAAPAEVRRAERLEMLDELEEWRLIQGHYCVAWGVNERVGGGGAEGPLFAAISL